MTTATETVLGDKIFLGRTPDGERVYVTIRVYHRSGHFQTVDHAPVGAFDELSITGEVYRPRARTASGAGQVRAEIRAVLAGKLAPGVSEDDVRTIIAAFPYHLNGLNAGCAHVEPVGKDINEWLDRTPACPVPETPYRYGTAWLVAPLPDGLVDGLRAACVRIGGRS